MRYNRALASFAHDVIAAAAAFIVALFLRLGGDVVDLPAAPLLANFCLFTACSALVFWATRVHRGIWRYVSVRDLALILRAVTLSVMLYVPVSFLLTRLEGVPRSLPAILWLVQLAFTCGPRLLKRLVQEGRLDDFWNADKGGRTRVLLAGAGDEAEMFIRATQSDRHSPYRVVGVLDEKGTRIGREIHGVAILGGLSELRAVTETLKRKHKAPQRLVLSKSASRTAGFEGFLAEAGRLGLTLAHLPSLAELHATEKKQADIRPIALEDLLGRAETVLDQEAIAGLVKGQRVLITGAGGTIGAELARQIAALKPAELLLLENSEFNLYTVETEIRERFPELKSEGLLADIRDAARIQYLFRKHCPQRVFHAAALKHVPISECNVRETLLTNVAGTAHVADAAASHGASMMVLISTDKAVKPSSVMGASKRIAEQYCQALDRDQSGTRFVTVRFGNVLGSTGSVVPRFQEQIAKGGPLTVTHPDITRYFMTVREAVELVLQASAHSARGTGERGRILVLDMGKPVKIADLARQMIRLAGLKPDEDIKITYTGLRPGEKLHEELFAAAEKLEPSGADGVLLAAAVPLPFSAVRAGVMDLAELLRGADPDEDTLREKIAGLVPEFAPDVQDEPAADAPRLARHG